MLNTPKEMTKAHPRLINIQTDGSQRHQKRQLRKVAPGLSMYKLVETEERKKIRKAGDDFSHIGCGGL